MTLRAAPGGLEDQSAKTRPRFGGWPFGWGRFRTSVSWSPARCASSVVVVLEETVTRTTPVPFYDLRPSHAGLRSAILGGISDLIDSNAYTNGPQVERFERA